MLQKATEMGYPTIDQERELVRRCEAGDIGAVDELVLRNARIVVPLMRDHRDISADDSFQAGILGMWRGTHKIKLAKWEESLQKMLRSPNGPPHPYAPFAMMCARREMMKESFYQGSSVSRGKVNMSLRKRATDETRTAWARTTRVVSIEHATMATNKGGAKEISGADDISTERGRGLVAAMERVMQTPAYDPQIEMDFEVITGIMDEVCTAREINIVRSYYGLDGEPCILEDLSDKWMLCRERIRQIRDEALAKVRRELSNREVMA